MPRDYMMNQGADDAPHMMDHSNGGMDHDSEMCVPLAALAMPGDDQTMNKPAEGDPVEFRVEGKVTRIDGDNAYVMPDSINGQPAKAEDPDKPKPDDADQEFAQLKDMASQQDSGAAPAAPTMADEQGGY